MDSVNFSMTVLLVALLETLQRTPSTWQMRPHWPGGWDQSPEVVSVIMRDPLQSSMFRQLRTLLQHGHTLAHWQAMSASTSNPTPHYARFRPTRHGTDSTLSTPLVQFHGGGGGIGKDPTPSILDALWLTPS